MKCALTACCESTIKLIEGISLEHRDATITIRGVPAIVPSPALYQPPRIRNDQVPIAKLVPDIDGVCFTRYPQRNGCINTQRAVPRVTEESTNSYHNRRVKSGRQ